MVSVDFGYSRNAHGQRKVWRRWAAGVGFDLRNALGKSSDRAMAFA